MKHASNENKPAQLMHSCETIAQNKNITQHLNLTHCSNEADIEVLQNTYNNG